MSHRVPYKFFKGKKKRQNLISECATHLHRYKLRHKTREVRRTSASHILD